MARTGTKKTVDSKVAEAEARRLAAARSLRNRRLVIGAVVTVILVGALVFFATRPEPEALNNVETFPDQGQAHLDPSSPAPEYNSDPPTSGPHAPAAAACGIYRTAVPDINLVHDLEHGVIVIYYNPDTAGDGREALEDFVRGAGTHAIVVPREGMESPIVLTAWRHLLRLDSFDRAAIRGFYGRYAQFGPERGVGCPLAVDQSQG
ncbi:MAG: DUF3105 domain-containing protein [Acidimicrobiia bacterium]